MSQSDLQRQIIAFAGHLSRSNEYASAFNTACEKSWLDNNGTPTDAGRDLIDALTAQHGTRSVFRQIA